MSVSMKLAQSLLGKEVEVHVDRPLGSKHPKHNFIYETNYGFIPNTESADGEELDAYYLGIDKPIKKAKGICIAIIHRINDDDDKLIVVPKNKKNISDKQIEKLVEFQEKWFEHVILRKDPRHILRYKEKLPYRQGVVGIIINSNNEFLVTQAHNWKEDEWRFAGGGLDKGENHEQALLRELREELGSDKFEIISTSSYVNKYDWPDHLIIKDRIWVKRLYRGQEQKQILVKHIGSKEEINPDSVELKAVKWVQMNDLETHFKFRGQWEMTKKVLEEFGLLK